MANQNNNGVTDDTTDVTIVAAPLVDVSRMLPKGSLSVYNKDTAAIKVFLKLKDGANDRIIEEGLAEPGDTFLNDKTHTLDTVNKILEIYLEAAVTANQADWEVEYRDEAQ